jgi:hypothetical protein
MIDRLKMFLEGRGFQGVQNFEDITSRFIEIARLVMCSHELVYGDRERSWRITALELYLHSGQDSAGSLYAR